MAAPPLPDHPPPMPQESGNSAPWAPPSDLLGSAYAHNASAQTAPADGSAPPWAAAPGSQTAYVASNGYQHPQQYQYQASYPQYSAQDPYGQQFQQQQQQWTQSQPGSYGYPGYDAQYGYGGQYAYPQQQQQQQYGASGQQPGAMNSPYAQMYGQTWSQGAYQQPQAGPPSGYGYSHAAQTQQCNPYGSLYGGAQMHAQAPSQHAAGQQPQAPWAALPASAPAQPLPPDVQPPLPGEPPLPGTPPTANGGLQQAIPEEPVHVPLPLPDVLEIVRAPGRAKRPKRVAVVLRGLPGSGKSHLARLLRDAEVAAGGEAPRIHSIDDYFITEIEKEVWEKDASGKRKLRLVQETGYQYEQELEEPYQASLLKAFQRTVDEANFSFVIVDADNLRFENFKAFWSAGQKAGYEVYAMEALELNPKVCHVRNIHGRSLADIKAAARMLERIPALYPQLDASGLLQKGLPERKQAVGIKEVSMADSEDEASDSETEAANALRAKSRWAHLEEGDQPVAQKTKKAKRGAAATPTVDQGQPSGRKRVRWPDEVDAQDFGFSIGGASRQQLETVYVLEGLGPPKDEAAAGRTFADQVKREHQSEGKSFRDILFGSR
ncbi:hypothetical protein CVIRNUC_003799 [Coccomyxa viridis]|uniref:YLP motif-containing protein 1 n=1 Tax=Coccomyxa viridis TaxID=1274662 RepID=A0AAV1I0N7_9CHLO|nr:hypothetical protein CVIRNUC_003799 [Coccomyxa viridis]